MHPLDNLLLDIDQEQDPNRPRPRKGPSGSKLRATVRWYQTILKNVYGFREVVINGRHNHGPTRAAMRAVQRQWGLKKVHGYLTVQGNRVITSSALLAIYGMPHDYTGSSWMYDRGVRQFQQDYGLDVDGDVGPATRNMMTSVLDGTGPSLPTGILSTTGVPNRQAPVVEMERRRKRRSKLASAGCLVQQQTTAIPNRWICRIESRFRVRDPSTLKFAEVRSFGTGVLIGPRHVLTAAHNIETYIRARSMGQASRILADGDTILGDEALHKATSMTCTFGEDARTIRKTGFGRRPFRPVRVSIAKSWIASGWKDGHKMRVGDGRFNFTSFGKAGYHDLAILYLGDAIGDRVPRPRGSAKREAAYAAIGRFRHWGDPELPDFVIRVAGQPTRGSPGEWLNRRQPFAKSLGYPGARSMVGPGVQVACRQEEFERHASDDARQGEELIVSAGHTEKGMSGSPLIYTDGSRQVLTGIVRNFWQRGRGASKVVTVGSVPLLPETIAEIVGFFPETYAFEERGKRLIGLRLTE